MAARVRGAVLALVWGGKVLVVRKRCPSNSPWACDIALPGGRVRSGEEAVDAALREAWEEAWIHPGMVSVEDVIGPFYTLRRDAEVMVVLSSPRGPLDPMPRDEEVDAAFWIPIDIAGGGGPVRHPVRGMVHGVYLGRGLVLWGVTLRILKSLLHHYRRV